MIACTTSGEISTEGILNHGISGMALFGDEFRVNRLELDNLKDFTCEENLNKIKVIEKEFYKTKKRL